MLRTWHFIASHNTLTLQLFALFAEKPAAEAPSFVEHGECPNRTTTTRKQTNLLSLFYMLLSIFWS